MSFAHFNLFCGRDHTGRAARHAQASQRLLSQHVVHRQLISLSRDRLEYASRLEIEGLSKALLQEVEFLSSRVMLVERSGFRTDRAGHSAHESPEHIADYAETAVKAREGVQAMLGHQDGDPVCTVAAIIKVVEIAAPLHPQLLRNSQCGAVMARLMVCGTVLKLGRRSAGARISEEMQRGPCQVR